MPREIVIEELHIYVRVPHALSERETGAAKQTLDSNKFLALLRRAVRSVAQRYLSLHHVRVTVSR